MSSHESTPGRFAAQYLPEGQAPGDNLTEAERIASAAHAIPVIAKTSFAETVRVDVEAAAIRPPKPSIDVQEAEINKFISTSAANSRINNQ